MAAALTGVSTAGDPDPLAVRDSGRQVHRDSGTLDRPASPAADLARLARNPAVAAAGGAYGCLDDLPERGARTRLKLAGAAAARARIDRGAGLGAVAVAVLAQRHRLVADLDAVAARSVGEADLGRHRDVAALDGAAAGAPAEEVTERARGRAERAAAAKERIEYVRDGGERVEVRRVPAAAQALVAIAVICHPPFGIGEHLVRLGGLLELLLRLRVVAVDVRVKLAGQPPEGLLDRGLVGVARDAEHVVVIPCCGHAVSARRRSQ